MPPKVQFERDQVVEAAFEIARAEGIDRITIRKVAGRLGSSIAPIYVNFNHVEQLKDAVVQKIIALSAEFLTAQQTGKPFYDIGRASLRFARAYPVLFLELIGRQNRYLGDIQQSTDRDLLPLLEGDPELSGLSDDEKLRLLLKMRIFHTGLAVMAANGHLPKGLDDEETEQLLFEAGEDLLQSAVRGVQS